LHKVPKLISRIDFSNLLVNLESVFEGESNEFFAEKIKDL